MDDAPATPALLEARDLRRVYTVGPAACEVLKGISLQVRRGESLCIMGASGAGKSTLLHILGGLDQPTAGTVWLDGQDLYALSPARRTELRAARLGFVFQAYHLLPELSVLENVLLPAQSRRGAWRRAEALRRRARELLERVALGHRADHRPSELSGGEQQRTALARALMNQPDLVLADEPTGNLDSCMGRQVLDYLFDLGREQGRTLVMVTHNEAVADRCTRKLVLRDGGLVP